jgi:integrase
MLRQRRQADYLKPSFLPAGADPQTISVKSARRASLVTPQRALLADGRGRPEDAAIRRALLRYGFNSKQRADPPEDVAEVLAWVARNSAPVSVLAEAAIARKMLDRATGRLDGKNAAASTARQHRTILANAMDYALELGLVETNPIRTLKWTALKVSSQVDRRSVVNPRRARALLEAVRGQQPSGPRLVAFFAAMYYAGLRPEEAINLRVGDVVLPLRQQQNAQDDRASCTCGVRHLMQAATGRMMGALASADSSSTAPRATAGSCRPIRS